MASRSPYKRQTKRSMIQSLPASSASRRRFISRKTIAMMLPLALFSGAVFLFFMPFNSWGQSSGSLDLSHRIHEIEVVAEFPHDPDAFTQVYVSTIVIISHIRVSVLLKCFSPAQGLLYAGNDTLFESTGLYGKVIWFAWHCLTLWIRFKFHSLVIILPLWKLQWDAWVWSILLFLPLISVVSEESGSTNRKGMVSSCGLMV